MDLAPLSEALWLLWNDHLEGAGAGCAERLCRLLGELDALMAKIAGCLGQRLPSAADLPSLCRAALALTPPSSQTACERRP